MTDTISQEKRSWNMSRIRSKDTKPELIVRKFLRNAGMPGYRLHWKVASCKPDICYPGRKIAIFVHGCYWHRHKNCKYAYNPKSRIEFWEKKFQGTVVRDKRNQQELRKLGWKVIVVWECQTKNIKILQNKLQNKM